MGTEFRRVGKCGNIEIRNTFLPKTALVLRDDGLSWKLVEFVAPSERMTAFWVQDNPEVSFHLVTISVPSSLASASQFLWPHLIAAAKMNTAESQLQDSLPHCANKLNIFFALLTWRMLLLVPAKIWCFFWSWDPMFSVYLTIEIMGCPPRNSKNSICCQIKISSSSRNPGLGLIFQ